VRASALCGALHRLAAGRARFLLRRCKVDASAGADDQGVCPPLVSGTHAHVHAVVVVENASPRAAGIHLRRGRSMARGRGGRSRAFGERRIAGSGPGPAGCFLGWCCTRFTRGTSLSQVPACFRTRLCRGSAEQQQLKQYGAPHSRDWAGGWETSPFLCAFLPRGCFRAPIKSRLNFYNIKGRRTPGHTRLCPRLLRSRATARCPAP
jgi:hypothetical protein